MKAYFRIFLLIVALVGSASASRAADKPLIALISGEYEYESASTLPKWKERLEQEFGLECVFLSRPEDPKTQSLPGLEVLENADLLVLYVRRMTLPEDQLAKIREYLNKGKPLIALRTSSHAFENWKEFDANVLGGNYRNHLPANERPTITAIESAQSHPILEGFTSFLSHGSLYRNTPLQPGARPLLTGKVEKGESHPVAWTRDYKGGRVFYTSLGHPGDFAEPAFNRLIDNAVFWALNTPKPLAIAPGPPKRVDVDEFERIWKSSNPVILDVRTDREVAAGRIPGSLHIDVNRPDFLEKVQALNPDRTYLVYCAGGVRSAKACEQLAKLNFKYLYDLAPGYRGWEKAGKETVK